MLSPLLLFKNMHICLRSGYFGQWLECRKFSRFEAGDVQNTRKSWSHKINLRKPGKNPHLLQATAATQVLNATLIFLSNFCNFPSELTSYDEKHGQKHFISITPFLSCSKETTDKATFPQPNDQKEGNGRSRWEDVSLYTALLLRTDDGICFYSNTVQQKCFRFQDWIVPCQFCWCSDGWVESREGLLHRLLQENVLSWDSMQAVWILLAERVLMSAFLLLYQNMKK